MGTPENRVRTKISRKKFPKILHAAGWGGTTVRNIYGKMVPLSFYHRVFRSSINFCQTFRAKKSIDTKAQKLLRPVLESAAQGLSSTISTVIIHVHSKIPIYYYLAPPSMRAPRPVKCDIFETHGTRGHGFSNRVQPRAMLPTINILNLVGIEL
eukprot:SAG11_NODE_90_length_17153_cov_63.471033_11_plen_154_part_00